MFVYVSDDQRKSGDSDGASSRESGEDEGYSESEREERPISDKLKARLKKV